MARRLSSRRSPPANVRRAELRRFFMAQHQISSIAADLMIAESIGDPATWSKHQLGKKISLTFAEKTKLAIRTIDCIDRTPEQVAAFYREARRARDREWRRRKREREKARVAFTSNLSVREEALFSIIGFTPASVPKLTVLCSNGSCWRGPDDKPLTGESLSRVLRRALDNLKREGWILDEFRPGSRGAFVRWVWRAPATLSSRRIRERPRAQMGLQNGPVSPR
jgi:hypothetical protein